MYRNKLHINSYKKIRHVYTLDKYRIYQLLGYTMYIHGIYEYRKKHHRDKHADGVIIPGMSTGTSFKRIHLILT